MPTDISNVIASRDMTWTRVDGVEFPVAAYVGDLNYVDSSDPDIERPWTASVQVLGPSINDAVTTVYGSDSVQALYHALALVGTILSSSMIASQIDFAILPNFGFPTLLTTGDVIVPTGS